MSRENIGSSIIHEVIRKKLLRASIDTLCEQAYRFSLFLFPSFIINSHRVQNLTLVSFLVETNQFKKCFYFVFIYTRLPAIPITLLMWSTLSLISCQMICITSLCVANYFHLFCIICKIFNQYCIYIHLCCFLGIGYYGLSQQISLAYLLIIELVNVQCALDGNFTLQMKRTCNTNRNYSIYNWKKNNKDDMNGDCTFQMKIIQCKLKNIQNTLNISCWLKCCINSNIFPGNLTSELTT